MQRITSAGKDASRSTQSTRQHDEARIRETINTRADAIRNKLITHLHESVPMYMDGSLKAAIDLKP